MTTPLAGTYQIEWLPTFALNYQGFSEPEYNAQQESYRWASAEESAMTVRLEPGQPYTITVTAAIPQAITTILVKINAHVVTTITTPQTWDWREFAISVPGKYVTTMTMLSFQATFKEPPADFRTHTRHGHSIAFQRITFEK